MKDILLVDDDKMFLESMLNILSEESYNLDSANTGPEALDKLKKKDYDLVILDYKMKPLDGLEVLKRIRDAGYDSSVIMISAYGSFDMASKALAQKAITILPKPIKAKRLKDAVKRALLDRILKKKGTTHVGATREEEEAASKGKDNVMVVDDSRVFRKMVINTIQGEYPSINFIEAENGAEAIEKLQKYDIKLIFLDINMPHMNGFEFMDLKKKSFKLRKVPIIVLTTEKQKETMGKAYLSGATIFMNKPFKKNELLKVLKTMSYWQNKQG